jgi:NAD(P)-dependent dehydrogenase (short-subunit alcohol dehydrogenase family)
MKLLSGKTVLITGAGSNVGRAAAALFARHGAGLALSDLAPERIGDAGSGANHRLTVQTDLTSYSACEALVQRTLDRFGSIEALCNTVGIDPPSARETLDTSEADWDRIMSVNLKAVFFACKATLPAMIARGRGSIVNIGSQGALSTLPGMTAYGVSKAGVLQLTRQIASDYGSRGVRANCVCPSGLEFPSADRFAAMRDEELQKRTETMRRISALGRGCTSADVAGAMLFLVSDLSGFITGAAIPVEGGATSMLHF